MAQEDSGSSHNSDDDCVTWASHLTPMSLSLPVYSLREHNLPLEVLSRLNYIVPAAHPARLRGRLLAVAPGSHKEQGGMVTH